MNTKDFRMAAVCGWVAVLAVLAAGVGVFARGDGSTTLVTSARGVTYEMATTGVYAYNAQRLVAEGVGWDVFTLLVAAPALLMAAWFVARGSFRGRLFALGLLGYFGYAYLEYAVSWAFGPLFLLFVVIYASSLLGILWIGVSVVRDDLELRFGDPFPRRSYAALNVTMSGLLVVMWLARIVAGLRGDLAAAGLAGETTLTVQALDLGLMVPISLLGAFLVWRGSAIGRALATAWSVTFVAMAAAIVSMLISAALVEGQLEIVPVAIFGLFAVVAAWIGLRIYRGLGADAPHRLTVRASLTLT
ncbi:MAG TPA: hypothetical protein VH987_05065 [Candidatus Limnocylindria bacterium]|jgi:hypothetical protein